MDKNQQHVSTTSPQKTFIPDNNVSFRPFISYTFYLFMRVIKNKSTWVLAIIAFAVTLFIAMVPVFGTDDATKIQILRAMNVVGAIVIIILSMVFGTIKALNIFTDSQNDGTELIIVSKPISRTQILVTRYVFFIVISLVFSLFIFGAWAIGLSIVGTGLVTNFGGALGGMFAASFIAQAITGVIAILIALKFSTRAARVIPIIIASISAIVSYVPMFVPIISQAGFNDTHYAKIDEVIAAALPIPTSKELTLDGKGVEKIVIKDPNGYNSYYNSPLKMIQNGNDYSLYLNSFYVYTDILSPVPYSFNVRSLVPGADKYAEWLKLYEFTNATVATALQSVTLPANGLVAINFINPVSAFTSIAGTSDDNLLSAFMMGGTTSFAYNYEYGDFKPGPNITINDQDYGLAAQTINLPSSITIGKHEQIDKQSTIALIWVGILLIAAGLSALVYYRKDFK